MPVRCDICGKGPQRGYNVSHSKKATRRRWLPNIQKVTVRDGDTIKRLKVCTSCMRDLNKG